MGLDEETRAYVAERSHAAKVPAALWLLLAIEAQRCVRRAAGVLGRSEGSVRETIDADAAVAVEPAAGDALLLLRGYADALRAGSGGAPAVTPPTLPLSPSTLVAAAWSIEASHLGMTVEGWASAMAAEQPASGVAWEASAALAGQSLAEWVLYQAARRRRSLSTSAHSTARG